jgi:LacI family transcriptional regulator, galactose operon repressor
LYRDKYHVLPVVALTMAGALGSSLRKSLTKMAKQRICTIKDVARVAGVSVSTVSAVINDKGVIGPELTEKVRQAVKFLGYFPHQGARGLRVGRNRIIGVVIPDVTNPFYVGILRAAEHAAKRSGYDVMMCDSDDQVENERRHLNSLHARRVEGIVLAPVDSYEARATARLSSVPMVFVDNAPLDSKANCVVTNNAEVSSEAIRYLLGLGHQRITMITRRPFQTTTIQRLDGYQRAMREAGQPAREEYIPSDTCEIDGAFDGVLRIMRTNEPPTAIFSMNSQLSLGIVQALRELEIRCPEQVSVIGFDDPDWAMVCQPALSSIRQPTEEAGQRAVQLLLRSIESAGAESEPEQILLKSSLCIRGTTGPAPGLRDPLT